MIVTSSDDDDSNDEKMIVNDTRMIVSSEQLLNSNCKIFVLQYRKTIPDFILQPSGKVFRIFLALSLK
jgi:hypothetical protein